jgi:hypothetical protein
MLTRSIVASAASRRRSEPFFLQWTCQPLRQRLSAYFTNDFNILAEIIRQLPPHYWAFAENSISAEQAPDQFLISQNRKNTGGHEAARDIPAKRSAPVRYRSVRDDVAATDIDAGGLQ